MYFVFTKFGQLVYALPQQPSALQDGNFVVEGDLPSIDTPYLFSDGKRIFETAEPPPTAYHSLVDGAWTLSKQNKDMMLGGLKADKLKQLNDCAQALIASAAGTGDVPEFELQTWPLQAAEAKAWAADKAVATPVLDQIAASRGIDADTLKAAALRKTLAYEQLSAHIAGQRQGYASLIDAATSADELEAIVFDFAIPEVA